MALIAYLTTIRFGCGVLCELPEDLAALSVRRPLIVTDKGVRAAGLLDRLSAVMPSGMPQVVFDDVPSNPTVRVHWLAVPGRPDPHSDRPFRVAGAAGHLGAV